MLADTAVITTHAAAVTSILHVKIVIIIVCVQDNGDNRFEALMMAVLRQVHRCHHTLATLALLKELVKTAQVLPDNVKLFWLGLGIATELGHNSRSPKKALEEVSAVPHLYHVHTACLQVHSSDW